MRTSFIASLVLASALGMTGAANATVYDLTYDHCTGLCGPQSLFGTVTTSDDADGVGMDVTVNLLNDDSFTSGGTHAFVFDLTGTPTISLPLTKLTTGFTFDPLSGGPYHEDGFGDWPYAIDFTSGKGGDNEQTTLSFEILGAGTNLASFTSVFDTTDNANIDFAADIWSGTTGKTGDVGAAAFAVSVPEPATWALMLLGVGGLGATLRGSRSRMALLPA